MHWTDFLASVLCVALAVLFSGLHIMTSRTRRIWDNVDEYVRVGFLVVAATMLGRGVDLFRLSAPFKPGACPAGRIDLVGLATTVAMVYAIGALAFSFLTGKHSAETWEKVHHVKDLAKDAAHGDALVTLQLRGVRVVPPKSKKLPPV